MKTIESKEPQAHTQNIRSEFRELIQHLRSDVKRVNEPKARALFETAAEVITGWIRRFNTTKGNGKKLGADPIVIDEIRYALANSSPISSRLLQCRSAGDAI